MNEFKREERYIVVKLKHLAGLQVAPLRNFLRENHVPQIECVVVEHDWPEYHLVWAMIEHRMAGKHVPDFNLWRRADELQQLLTKADQRVDDLETEIEKLKAGLKWESERNALLLASLTEAEDMLSVTSLEAGQRLTASEQRNSELVRELEVYRGAPAGWCCVGLRKDGDLFVQVFPLERTAQAWLQHHSERGYVCAIKPVTLPGNDAALKPTESGASE